MQEEFQDPAGIQNQDLLNTSQTLLSLSHLDPWAENWRQATYAALPSGFSQIPLKDAVK